jgi:hypothetical protein
MLEEFQYVPLLHDIYIPSGKYILKSKTTSHTRINQICYCRNKETQYVHVICYTKQQRNMIFFHRIE